MTQPREAYSTLDFVLAILLGTLLGVINTQFAIAGNFIVAIGGVLLLQLIYGWFFLAGSMTGMITQKPGLATLAMALNGVIQVLTGNPFGIVIFAVGILQGIGIDIVLALRRYRDFSIPTMALAGAVAASIYAPLDYVVFFQQTPIMEFLLWVVLRALSGVVFGILTVLIVRALQGTGVLNSFAVARTAPEEF